jgi:peptide deformylase
MRDTMAALDGAGLAAPQIGVSLQVVIFGVGANPRYPDAEAVPYTELLNPALEPVGDAVEEGWEGCLSVPEIYADVERPATCTVRYQDLDGTTHEEALEGLLATCLQHEMDHLEGILFIDHLSRLKKAMALKKLEKIRRAA